VGGQEEQFSLVRTLPNQRDGPAGRQRQLLLVVDLLDPSPFIPDHLQDFRPVASVALVVSLLPCA
jgi:hypothetical protein